MLDQAVKNSARRELEGQRKRRPLRWLGAFATATVAVLALTIMIQQDEQPLSPALEGPDGLKLEQATPATSKKEARRDETQFRSKQNAVAAPAAVASNAESADEASDADAWVERLLLLQETRQDEKLLRELAAFRKAYPDYILPPALRD